MGDSNVPLVPAGLTGFPAMPEIPPGEQDAYTGPRILAPVSGRHFIGWHPRLPRKGGACFVVGRRTLMDDLKVIERFPLTEDGWHQARQALVRTDAAAAMKAQVLFAERASWARANVQLAAMPGS